MLTIAIPTYNRGAILCDTIEMLLRLDPIADEILIVDQTLQHPPDVDVRLRRWESEGTIRMIRLPKPTITGAMNRALREAVNERVLFLDDDIIPCSALVATHAQTLSDPDLWASVGQVLQPGEHAEHHDSDSLRGGPIRDLEFRFNHDEACDIQNVMAGNLCVRRDRAQEIGGFDENFIAVAYRFETDFALRLVAAGGRIRFTPGASILHLKAGGGGVRTWGDHRTSASPAHSVGDYYFARKHVGRFWSYVVRRLGRNVGTRFHLTHPWTIAPKLIGELRGLMLAFRLTRQGGRQME